VSICPQKEEEEEEEEEANVTKGLYIYIFL
jgi:hypothetical protein